MVACQTENSPIWPADSVNSTGFVIFAAWMDYLRKQFARPLLVNSRHCKTLHYHSLRNFQHERRIFDDISGNFIVNELFALSSFPLALPPFLFSVTSLVFLLLLSLSLSLNRSVYCDFPSVYLVSRYIQTEILLIFLLALCEYDIEITHTYYLAYNTSFSNRN